MGYRKINVNGYNYEYVIGRDHTKIKFPGGGSYTAKNGNIGKTIDEDTYMVTPGDIRRVIENFAPIPV